MFSTWSTKGETEQQKDIDFVCDSKIPSTMKCHLKCVLVILDLLIYFFFFLSEEIHHIHIKMFFFFQLHQAVSLMFSDMILLRFLGNFGVMLHRLNLATTKALLRIRKWLEEKVKSGKKPFWNQITHYTTEL